MKAPLTRVLENGQMNRDFAPIYAGLTERERDRFDIRSRSWKRTGLQKNRERIQHKGTKGEEGKNAQFSENQGTIYTNEHKLSNQRAMDLNVLGMEVRL